MVSVHRRTQACPAEWHACKRFKRSYVNLQRQVAAFVLFKAIYQNTTGSHAQQQLG
jgi:hypothetical protein